MVDKVEPLMFDLCYRAEAYDFTEAGGYLRRPDRDATLEVPPKGFKTLRAHHGAVSKHADYLNDIQRRAGHMDYFFFPEMAEEAGAR